MSVFADNRIRRIAWLHLIHAAYLKVRATWYLNKLDFKPLLLAPASQISEEAWRDTSSYLTKIVRLLKDLKIPFVLILFPTRGEVESEMRGDIKFRMQSLAQDERFHLLDLFPIYTRFDENLYDDSGHPNGRGHEIAAEALFQILVSEVEPILEQ